MAMQSTMLTLGTAAPPFRLADTASDFAIESLEEDADARDVDAGTREDIAHARDMNAPSRESVETSAATLDAAWEPPTDQGTPQQIRLSPCRCRSGAHSTAPSQ
jgi:hypothetical protein